MILSGSIGKCIRNVKISFFTFGTLKEKYGVRFIGLSFIKFVVKLLSLLVMFLPIKLLIVMSADSSIHQISSLNIEVDGVQFKSLFLLAFISIFLSNIFGKYYSNKVFNEKNAQVKKIGGYYLSSFNTIVNIYVSYFVTIFSILVLFYLSSQFMAFYILSSLFYFVVLQYFVFNKASHLFDRFKQDKRQICDLTATLALLVQLFAIFSLFYMSEVSLEVAIFSIFLIRMSIPSLKNLIVDLDSLSEKHDQFGVNGV